MPNPAPRLTDARLSEAAATPRVGVLDVVEPSDSERAEWPDATREYVAALEHYHDEASRDLAALVAEVEALRAEREAIREKYEVTVKEWQHAKAAHEESERSGRALLLHLIGMDPDEFRRMKEDAARYRFLRDNPLGLRAIDGSAGLWLPESLDSSVDHTMSQEATNA